MAPRHLRIALVGMGPRGLGALESLSARVRTMPVTVEADLFDPFPSVGAGPNFDPQESPLCLLNIPNRDIDIRPPEEAPFGSFAEWLDRDPDPDRFPQRCEIGCYLRDRFAALRRSGALSLYPYPQRAERVRRDDDGWRIRSQGLWHGPYSEVLIAIGQPEVTPDDQIATWQRHAEGRNAVLAGAYPAARLQAMAADWSGRTVAIRGLGLSTLDVLRVLTAGQGGRFDAGRYRPSGREPARILPFSLDGKPPFPKPADAAIDARFAPTPAETERFSRAIAAAARAGADRARELVSDALAPAANRILADLDAGQAAGTIAAWLETEWSEPGSQETCTPPEVLSAGIDMADGRRPPDIGYTIGQLWRKWQDELRVGYNPAETSPSCASRLIGFDEGLKRYSYGPPVTAARELQMLADAGPVDLSLTTDPEIGLTDGGWRLARDEAAADASVMIDAVLASPDLGTVTDPLVRDLIDQGRLRALGEGLAAATAADGSLIDRDGQVQPSLCLLGRLALGSVIAADSLHDCFGAAADRWADGVVARMG